MAKIDPLDLLTPYIETLLPAILDPKFQFIFKVATKNLSTSERFILKMELQRLVQPCQRPIDLRDSHPKDCKLYEYEGLQHFLSEDAIIVFEQSISHFNYQYIYAVHYLLDKQFNRKNAERDKKPRVTKTIATHLQRTYTLGQRLIRSEERMNYYTLLEINGLLIQQDIKIHGSSKDISVHGLCIRLELGAVGMNVAQIQKGQIVTINFCDLSNKYQSSICFKQRYRLLWRESVEQQLELGLSLITEGDSVQFCSFIESLIKRGRRKYRLDSLNRVINAYLCLLENYYFHLQPCLTVFGHCDKAPFLLRYLCKQAQNSAIVDYWCDERGVNQLQNALSLARLSPLMPTSSGPTQVSKSCLLYCFTHKQNGQIYHFSATLDELKVSGLRELYFSFGASKESWRVYKVEYQTIVIDMPLVNEQHCNKNELSQILSGLNSMILLTDLTCGRAKLSYKNTALDHDRLNLLNCYKGNKSDMGNPAAKVISFDYLGQRSEARCDFVTSVELRTGSGCFIGRSCNFSANGLQVIFDKAISLELNTIVRLSFPDLQLTTRSYKLSDLPYSLLAKNSNSTQFSFKVKLGPHEGKRYFSTLIQRKACENQSSSDMILGLEDALQHVTLQHSAQHFAYLYRNEQSDETKPLNKSEATSNLEKSSTLLLEFVKPAINGDLSGVFALLTKKDRDKLNTELLLRAKRNIKQAWQAELLVSYKANAKQALESFFIDDLNSEDERKSMVNSQLNHSEVMVIKISAVLVNTPNYHAIEGELDHLSVYHPSAKQALIKKAQTLIACLFFTDITEEISARYHISQDLFGINSSL